MPKLPDGIVDKLKDKVTSAIQGKINDITDSSTHNNDSQTNNTPGDPVSNLDETQATIIGEKEMQAMLGRARISGLGDPETDYGRSFYGLNIKGQTTFSQLNQESVGLVFFTRPNCFLTENNCIVDRNFVDMLNTDPMSIYAAIRAYLDPMGQRGDSIKNVPASRKAYINSDLVDPRSPWISLLTNTCRNLSGWPDPVMDTYEAPPGRRQEVFGHADGVYKVFGQFTLSGVFKNIPYDPVRRLIDFWCRYQANISMGRMYPRLTSIVNDRINYQTRVYRLVMDRSRQYVTRIAACGAAYPLVNDIGKVFDYNDNKMSVDADDVSVQFKCYGAIYDDPLLVRQFNQLTMAFHPELADDTGRARNFKKLKANEWAVFNHAAYPLIDENTRALDWWVTNTDYEAISNYYPPIPNSVKDADPVANQEPGADSTKSLAQNMYDIVKNNSYRP